MEYITKSSAAEPGKGRVVIEETVMEKGEVVTAGSKMLTGYISPIESTAVARLKMSGYRIVGRARTEEFGLRVAGTADISGVVKAVSEGAAEFGLCNDYMGVVRSQAVRSGLCYIHPSYGTVSRYGLIPAVPSMDSIGIVCKDVKAGFELLSVIAGADTRDGAMYPDERYTYKPLEGTIRLAVPASVLGVCDEKESQAVKEFASEYEVVNMELPYFDYYTEVMNILTSAELSNNISRYDGIKYGYRTEKYSDLDELYMKSRGEGFTREVKLFALMGALVLSGRNYERYYEKAMKIRRMIKDSLKYDNYDAIALPVMDSYPGLNVLPQLAGNPSLTLPVKGCAVSIIAPKKREGTLLSFC